MYLFLLVISTIHLGCCDASFLILNGPTTFDSNTGAPSSLHFYFALGMFVLIGLGWPLAMWRILRYTIEKDWFFFPSEFDEEDESHREITMQGDNPEGVGASTDDVKQKKSDYLPASRVERDREALENAHFVQDEAMLSTMDNTGGTTSGSGYGRGRVSDNDTGHHSPRSQIDMKELLAASNEAPPAGSTSQATGNTIAKQHNLHKGSSAFDNGGLSRQGGDHFTGKTRSRDSVDVGRLQRSPTLMAVSLAERDGGGLKVDGHEQSTVKRKQGSTTLSKQRKTDSVIQDGVYVIKQRSSGRYLDGYRWQNDYYLPPKHAEQN